MKWSHTECMLLHIDAMHSNYMMHNQACAALAIATLCAFVGPELLPCCGCFASCLASCIATSSVLQVLQCLRMAVLVHRSLCFR